jgi:hypothetical protein
MNAKEILNEFKEANQSHVTRADQEIISERLISETYKLEGNRDLLDSTIHWSVRAVMAQQTARKILAKEQSSVNIVLPQGPQITQAESAANIKNLLKDPRLTKEQREALMDAAWYVAAAPEETDKEKIEADLKKEKLTAVANKIGTQPQDSVSSEYGRLKKKLEREGVNSDEVNDARAQKTIEYLERVENDKDAKRTLSNSRKDLLALEMQIKYLHQNAKNLSDEDFNESFSGIATGLSTVASIAASGGARQMFRQISQQNEARIAKMASKAVGQFAGKAAAGAANAILPGSGLVVGKVVGKAAEFLSDKAFGFIRRNKGKIAQGAAVIVALPMALLTGSVSLIGAGLAGAGVALVSAGVVIPIILAFLLFIINSGAYIVPPGTPIDRNGAPIAAPGGGGGGSYPPGAIVSNCPTTGDITAQLAASVKKGVVKLLPDYLDARSTYRKCFKPTMMIMHWSAGSNDNPIGNDATYQTLIRRNLACQLMVDADDTWFTQPFYKDSVELAWCAGVWNVYGISNEMAGTGFTASPPPPNKNELDLTYDVTCKVMKQYKIPWCQVFGHFEVPYSGKADPGVDFMHKVFVPQIKRLCPNDPTDICKRNL